MKILIAGATGLIGKELVSKCLNENHTVHYLTTRKGKIKTENKYKGFYWNPTQNIIDTAAFEGVEVIVNLAGASVSKKWTKSYKQKIINSRIATAKLLFQFLKENPNQVRQYISASGISVYPDSLHELYTESSTTIAPTFLGEVVEVWEQVADQFSEIGIKVVKVRTGIVLDTHEGALPQLIKPIKLNVGAAIGSGKQWQSWIHVSDIAGIYMHLINEELEGIFNGVSPNPKRNIEMTRIIAKYLGKKLWLPKVPAFVLRIVLGERSGLVLESQLVSSEKIQNTGYTFQYINLENAIEDLL